MTDRTIGEEIGSISKMFLGGLLIIALMAIGGTVAIRWVFLDYQSTAKESLNAAAIFEDTFEARLDGLGWRNSPNAAREASFFGNVDEVVELGPDASSDQMRSDLQRLQTLMQEYSGHFQTIVDMEDTYRRQISQIESLGAEAQKALSQIIEGARGQDQSETAYLAAVTQQQLLSGWLYLEKYIATEATPDFNTAIAHLADAEGTVQTLVGASAGAAQAQARAAQGALVDLRSLAEQLIALVRDRVAAADTMDATGPEMVIEIEGVVDGIIQRQTELGPRGETFAIATVVLISLVSAAIIFFGWRSSTRRAGALVARIEASIDTMAQIADGDLDAEVQNTDLENELGRMARALQVFKTNGKAALEASAREKAQELKRQREAEEAAAEDARREEATRQKAEQERQEMTANLGRSLGSVVNAASAGDFTARVEADFSDPELVRLAKSVNSLVSNVEGGLGNVLSVLTHLSEGDLTQRMDGTYHGTFADVQSNLNATMDTLSNLISKISQQSGTVLSHASSMSQGASDLSQRAVKQAASLEETAAAMEQVSASAKLGETGAGQATDNAMKTRAEVLLANQTMQDAIVTMEAIKADSQKIAEIVDVIDGIAVQTSLLSLNASVEAARAGDAGKGFAVVASEVRGLAVRSAEASKDIAALIEQSTRGIEAGVEKVKATGQALSGVEQHVSEMATLMEDLAESGKQQATAIHEVTNAMSDMDRVTQSNATLADETNVSARTSSQEANATQNLLATFIVDPERARRKSSEQAA